MSLIYSNKLSIDVFYNCGDPQLNYVVSDFINGPNYNLSLMESVNNTGFFKFEN